MKTRIYRNKEQIFCAFRHRWVRLTPEEWVRQNFLHRLVEEFCYPTSLIGVEVPIMVGDAQRRCDAVVYSKTMQPLLLMEFKAESVMLTQRTLDQALTYNRRLHVPYLILHNGPQTIVAQVTSNQFITLNTIPEWKQLSL